jgi:hypothetical protein
MNLRTTLLRDMVTDGVAVLRAERETKPDRLLTQREAQSRFAFMTSLLVMWAMSHGYDVTFGESFDDDGKGHMAGSLHYIRLAQDLNLFRDGKFLTATEDHRPLGEFWESLGGTWGGRFSDGNHYSLAWGGRK